jgi:hypothetical protein
MAARGRMQRVSEPEKERAREGATARRSGAKAEEKANSEIIQTV